MSGNETGPGPTSGWNPDDGWDEEWSDWTDDVAAPDVDEDASTRRREAARRVAEHDEPAAATTAKQSRSAARSAARSATRSAAGDEASGRSSIVSSGTSSRGSQPGGSARRSVASGSATSAPPRQTRVVEDRLARPARRGTGCLTGLIVLGMLAAIAGLGYRWVQRQIDPGTPGEVVEVAVPSGTSGSELGDILQAQGIISNTNVWRVWSQMNSVGKFQAGRYRFAKNSSFDEVVAVLAEAPAVPQQQPLTIPPGFRITQIADRVAELPGRDRQRFLDAAAHGTVQSALLPTESAQNLEGFIVAETINFDLDDDETEILVKLVDEWDAVAREAGLLNAEKNVGYTPYQVLIIASLIEREAKFDDERPKVARVVYNRLKGDMHLQLDATTVYDLGGGVPTAADLKQDGPYNTYTRKGLPPTPIATPSVESIKAALAPAEGDWKYYVVTEKDGRSSFANTFAEHRRNIALGKKNGAL